MSSEAKWIVVGVVLFVIAPLMARIVRRMMRGERFENKGTIMPPIPPSIDIGQGS